MISESNRTRKTSGKITLADVAKFVGVGSMTVSRALRTPEVVSEDLRKKIEKAVIELGYVPNFSARQLASASSKNLVIVTSSITSTENTLILSALNKSISELELQMVILVANEKYWLRELINHSPQAIILLNFDCSPNAIKWIKQSGIPTIEIGAKQQNPININIGIDSRVSMQHMINFLLNKGHKEIGLLSSNQDLSIFQKYLESWHTTLLKKHVNPHLIYHSAEKISFSTGASLFNDAILEWGKVDALVFLSDELACGALYEAHRKHFSIPNDMAIVSLGGLDVGSVSYPKLTTISIPYEKMGILAGQKLVDIIKGNISALDKIIIDMPTSLIERDSA
ncbi:LacI family DNA-binding transcriptional regulator [Otariodibacter sp.]|uniref:LacI family DNA-binding transcriptional regulator n=1 Tax=Otariodibacter sp. TaxID=3030919 RepID=UPI0026198B74|nr:LacI family DNA-binding transcriptional regulator [Otariodibacter sp.]